MRNIRLVGASMVTRGLWAATARARLGRRRRGTHLVATKNLAAVIALAVAMANGRVYAAGPDHLSLVVSSSKATNGAAIAAYGYDPINDTIYSAGFTGGAQIYQVTNVSSPAAQVSTQFVSTNDWLQFFKDGHTDWAAGTPTIGSLVLNPKPIYDSDGVTVLFPAYSLAWIEDQTSDVREGTSTYHYELQQRVYRYNLLQVSCPPIPPAVYGDGRDVFVSLASIQDLADAIGVTPPGTSNSQKQVAFSTDGQWVYFNESGTTYGGIWKVRARDGGGLSRIHAAASSSSSSARIYTDPGVVHTSVRDLDRANPAVGDQILFRGTTTSGNLGGIDYLIDDGTTVSGPFVFLTSAVLQSLLNISSDPDIQAVLVDADANIYLAEGTSGGLYRYDAANRLVKLKSRKEHVAFNKANSSTSANVATQELQARTVQYDPTGGEDPSQAYPVLQLLFRSVALKGVGGVYAFVPGDFDRDGRVTAADLAFFGTQYAKGPTTPSETDPEYVAYLRADLNGDASVDSRDRLIFGTFLGDFDGDGDVDLADFSHFQGSFNGPNRAGAGDDWGNADLDGDHDVDLADFAVFQSSFNGPNRPLASL